MRKGVSRDSREGAGGYKHRGPRILGAIVDVRGQFRLCCGAGSPEGTILFARAHTSYGPTRSAVEKGSGAPVSKKARNTSACTVCNW